LRFGDQIPKGHLTWMLNKSDMEAEKKLTAKYWLEWRRDEGFMVNDAGTKFPVGRR
jgi:hypothetical protein